jgi:hypothetical protein
MGHASSDILARRQDRMRKRRLVPAGRLQDGSRIVAVLG